mmetsp:Transcript_71961/g.208463  ORF Transcript_71961/g.208463 Transcript_71961/m.208463 type:complete len:242 (+) Transcript_71961:99-824(+)
MASTSPETAGGLPPLKLSYFRVRGRAELIRLTLSAGGVPFEDERVSREEQQRRKAAGELPFGQFPTLSVGGQLFAQSYSIAKYAARLSGLMPSDPLDVLKAEGVVDATDDVRSKLVPIRYLPVEPAARLERYAQFFRDTLPLWLRHFEKLCADGGFLVGGALSVADLAVFNMCDYLTLPSCEVLAASPEHAAMAASCLDGFPGLQAHRRRVAEVPGVAAWLEKRPKTPHDNVLTLTDADFS